MSNLENSYSQIAARIAVVLSAFCLLFGAVFAAPASANMVIDFDFDSILRGEQGSVAELASVPVEADDIGKTCLMAAVAENQVSVHTGNDLIVSTGDSQAIILGVEDEANGGTTERYAITLGSTVVVQLRFGADRMSSLGFNLDIDCEIPLDQAGLLTTIVPTTIPTTTTTCPAVQSVDDQGNAVAIPGGCQQTTLCPDGSVATPLDNGSPVAGLDSDGCPTTTVAPTTTSSTVAPTTAAPTTTTTTTTTVTAPPASAITCANGMTPVQVAGQSGLVCPTGQAVTDLPETPSAQPIVAAPAYTG